MSGVEKSWKSNLFLRSMKPMGHAAVNYKLPVAFRSATLQTQNIFDWQLKLPLAFIGVKNKVCNRRERYLVIWWQALCSCARLSFLCLHPTAGGVRKNENQTNGHQEK